MIYILFYLAKLGKCKKNVCFNKTIFFFNRMKSEWIRIFAGRDYDDQRQPQEPVCCKANELSQSLPSSTSNSTMIYHQFSTPSRSIRTVRFVSCSRSLNIWVRTQRARHERYRGYRTRTGSTRLRISGHISNMSSASRLTSAVPYKPTNSRLFTLTPPNSSTCPSSKKFSLLESR